MNIYKLKLSKWEIVSFVVMMFFAIFLWFLVLNSRTASINILTPIVLTLGPLLIFIFKYLQSKSEVIIHKSGIEFKSIFKNYTLKNEELVNTKKHLINPNILFLLTNSTKYKLPINVENKIELLKEIESKVNSI